MEQMRKKEEQKSVAGGGMSPVQRALVIGNQASIHGNGLQEGQKPMSINTGISTQTKQNRVKSSVKNISEWNCGVAVVQKMSIALKDADGKISYERYKPEGYRLLRDAEKLTGKKYSDDEQVETMISDINTLASEPAVTGISELITKLTTYKTEQIKKLKTLGKYESFNEHETASLNSRGPEDYKMDALHFIALETAKKLKENNFLPGPHIAISMVSGTVYASINSHFRVRQGKERPNNENFKSAIIDAINILKADRNEIKEEINGMHAAAEEGTVRNSRADRIKDPKYKEEIINWLTALPTEPEKIKVLDRDSVGLMPKVQEPEGASVHGEVIIASHLKQQVNTSEFIARKEKLKRLPDIEGKTAERVIRIGGTLIDCADCASKHHGSDVADKDVKMKSLASGKEADTKLFGESHDDTFSRTAKSRILSSAVRGEAFPNWTDTTQVRTSRDLPPVSEFTVSEAIMEGALGCEQSSQTKLVEIRKLIDGLSAVPYLSTVKYRMKKIVELSEFIKAMDKTATEYSNTAKGGGASGFPEVETNLNRIIQSAVKTRQYAEEANRMAAYALQCENKIYQEASIRENL